MPLAFVTNSAERTPAQVAAKLDSHGVPDAESLVITAAMAAAAMIDPADRVFVVGSDGLREAVAARGATIVGSGSADVAVVGITLAFDYDMLTAAMRTIRAGARFIATNDDATFPDADGLLPGNGALVAAVATAAGVEPEIAGKPHEAIAELVRERIGDQGVMVGDRPETDGRFAESLGYEFALVLTGVVGETDLPVTPTPRFVAHDIAGLVDQLL